MGAALKQGDRVRVRPAAIEAYRRGGVSEQYLARMRDVGEVLEVFRGPASAPWVSIEVAFGEHKFHCLDENLVVVRRAA